MRWGGLFENFYWNLTERKHVGEQRTKHKTQ